MATRRRRSRGRSSSSSSSLVPVALAGVGLVWLARRAGGQPLTGTIPTGGPFATLIFVGRNSIGVDGADVATAARERVAAVRYQGGVPWVVTEAASLASGRGEGSNFYTTVLVRVGAWMEGKSWSVLLDPLKIPAGGGFWVGGNVALVEARTSGPTLDLARQTELGLGTDSGGNPNNPSILDRIKSLMKTGETIAKVAVVVAVAGALYLGWREIKPFLPSTYRRPENDR